MQNSTELFDQYVKKRYNISSEGKLVAEKEGAIVATDKEDPFNTDVKKEFRTLKFEERKHPLFECEKDGEKYFVIPMVGKGLWGPVWGYVALKSDYNTIYGAIFDHKTETPGLGAEIKGENFEKQFLGLTIMEGEKFKSIKVHKGGSGLGAEDVHGVDGISGGTITSKGVDEMLKRTLEIYSNYFKTL